MCGSTRLWPGKGFATFSSRLGSGGWRRPVGSLDLAGCGNGGGDSISPGGRSIGVRWLPGRIRRVIAPQGSLS